MAVMNMNRNMEDPAVQESIRRQSHEYAPSEGRHGLYKPKAYVHQEYPKMMLKLPRPTLKDFQGQPAAHELYETAARGWDSAMSASVVHNKTQETAWLKENAG